MGNVGVIKRVAAIMFTVVFAVAAKAQSIDEIIKQYPGEHAVMLKFQRDTRIFYKNDQPVAETKEETEILVLSDVANGIYNKYKIFHGFYDELLEMEAYTKVPEGTKYKKLKVTNVKTQNASSSGIFFDDAKETVFDFPSMLKGAIASVTHKEFHKDAHLLTPFYFTSYIPVVSAKFTLTFPQNMQVKYLVKNDQGKQVQMREEKKGRQVVYEFTADNQKSKDRFGDAPPRSHYEPHVIVHIANYTNDKGEQVSYLNNVDDLYKWNASFLKEVNKEFSPLLKNLSDSLTKGVATEKEKAKAIYKWVQDNIKYVAFEEGIEGFRPRQAVDVCTKRYGDCKDMSSLLTALMQHAGIKAYFTWIGTRDLPYEYSEVPLPITDNHMICTVNIDGEWIFVDGTDAHCVFGTPSKHIQGKQALVGISEKEYQLIRVPELAVDKNYVVDTTYISFTDKGIKGKSSVFFNGYFGIDLYSSMQYQDTKSMQDYVKARVAKGSNKFILEDYAVNKVNNIDKVMNIQTSFEVPDYGKKISDELYINLHLDRFYSTAVIDTVKRKVAVDNDFRFHVKNYTILEVPQGYEVQYMPENLQYKNDLFTFNINYTLSSGKVIASQHFTSDVMRLEPQDFNKWNETVKEINNQYKKQLVLKKK